ncbi:hypothetical protein [Nocardia sp. BMG51109]|uniref:hypothetical protein n=1 Tax=Nocardia sp. BMG51109 TaxID=1056816 RepID=UPI0012EC8E5A|nr:hypothetical protein [Nocardia sp. BMG51109]
MVRGREWTGFEAVALQEAMRKSVREFAALLGTNPSTVINWRTGLGSVLPRSVTQEMLDTTLQQRATSEDRARFDQIVAEGESLWRARHDRPTARDVIPCEAVLNQSGAPSSPLPEAATVGGSPLGVEGEDFVERKTFLQVFTGSMAGLALGAAGLTEAHDRLVKAADEPPRVDAALIEHFDRICDYCRHQDDIQGAQAVLTVVRAQLRLLHAMLPDCPARLQPQLLAVYSKFAGLAGWLSLDARQFANSWRYFEVAQAAAHQAGASALIGFTLARMSHVAKAQDRLDLAVDYASSRGGHHQAGRAARPYLRLRPTARRLVRRPEDEAKCLDTLEKTRSSYQRAKTEAPPPVRRWRTSTTMVSCRIPRVSVT